RLRQRVGAARALHADVEVPARYLRGGVRPRGEYDRAQLARVRARLAREHGDRDVQRIAERGREAERHAGRIAFQTLHDVLGRLDARVGLHEVDLVPVED